MLNFDTALKSTETSINSQGSALREQEIFATSLEGRINRLQNAWTGFAATTGDAVLYDGIVVLTEIFKNLTTASDSAVGKIGLLAPVLGTVATAAVFFSSSLRGLVVSKVLATKAAVAQAVATGGVSTAMGIATVASRALAISLRSLLIASGVGAVFVALGFAIEKLVGVYSDSIQAQEKFDTYNRKNVDALNLNRKAVDELISEYDKLTKQKENDKTWDSTKENEYLGVQQRLADFYPGLIDYIDSSGQAHLKSKEEIDKEIASTEKLVEAQNKVKLAGIAEEFEKLQSTLSGGTFDSLGNFISGSIEGQIKAIEKAIATQSKQGLDTTKLEYELLVLEQQFQDTSDKIKGLIFETANATEGLRIDDSVKKSVETFVRSLDVSNLNPTQLKEFGEALRKVQDTYQEAVNNQDEALYSKAQEGLNGLAGAFNLLDGDLNKSNTSYTDFVKSLGKGDIIQVEGEIGELSDSVNGATDALNGFKSVAESLAGVSQQQVDDVNDLIFQYDTLTSQLGNFTEEEIRALATKKDLTSEEKTLIDTLQQRDNTLQNILNVYPELLNAEGKSIASSEEKIKKAKEEAKANEVLLKAYQLSKDGKLSAEQQSTLAQAQGTKARIDNIKLEIQALNLLQRQLQEYYNEQAKQIDPNDDSYSAGYGAYRSGTLLGQTQSQVTDYTSELDALQSQLNGNIGTIDTFSKAIENESKSKKESNKTTKESIYVTDEYKLAIEALNLAIEKQQKLRSQYPTYSKEYQDSLKKEIELEKQQLALEEAQLKSLKSQISSGKIRQTGLIDVTPNTTTTSSSGYNPAFNGRITSGYGNRIHPTLGYNKPHNGIDIASPTGTRVNANVNGRVTSQGYNEVSGNYVKIEDSNGFKHFYAHLDKAFAKVGDIVQAGTQIGNVGSTGRSTGAHLHYEVKNALNEYINPEAFINSAKSGKGTSTSNSSGKSASTLNAEKAQSLDQANSDAIQKEIGLLERRESIRKKELELIDSELSAFEYRRQKAEDVYNFEEAKLKNIDKFSERYTKTIDIQRQQLEYKQSANNDELAYLDKLLKSNTLNAVNQAEMKSRYNQVKTAIQEVNNEIAKIDLKKFEVNNVLIERNNNLLDYNAKVLETLSKGTERYQGILQENIGYLTAKQKVNQQELESLKKMAISGKYSGEVLEEINQRVQDLTLSVKDLALEIQETNFEIIVDIKTRFDEAQDDIQFEIDKSEIFKGTYTQGSALYNAEIQKQIELYQKLAQSQDESRRKLQEELNTRNLTAERIKEVTELLEDETLAYLNSVTAIDKLNEELKKSQDALKKDIADGIIAAMKAYYQERKDEHLKAIEAELKAETEAHEKRKKQLTDELDLFRKNVEERIRLIDRQESERGYNQEIEELEKERSKVQDDINLLALDNSNEAKSKRKKLQEQLDKIDKDIAEKRHDRDIELQKQGLNDLLEGKQQEIDGKLEIEDQEYNAVVERINKEKAYWEKHYNDLMNDERKFAKIREDIAKGNFANIQAEFGTFIQNLIDTLPALEDTLDGTMEAAGTSIRLNVIDQLREAIKLIDDFNALQSSTSGGSTGSGLGTSSGGVSSDNFNPNAGRDDLISGSVGNSNNSKALTDADMKVLFAKYMREQLVTFEPIEKNKESIRVKANQLASEGRKQGSTISSSVGLDSALAGYDKKAYQQFSRYILANATTFVQQPNLQQQVRQFGNRIASLDTGGMLSTRGGGVDGKGGKYFIGHDGEVVNNPLETSQLLKTASISNSILDKLKSLVLPALSSMPSLPNLANQNNIGGDTYEINFNGNITSTSVESARTFAKEIMNTIKTKKG